MRSLRHESGGPLPGLTRVELNCGPLEIPARVGEFIEDAEREVERFRQAPEAPVREFVCSSAPVAYHALMTIREQRLAPGRTFCEWGSGIGLVAGLAELAGFEARGIELADRLFEVSRRLLARHGLSAPIAHGSFKPVRLQEGPLDNHDLPLRFDERLGFHPVHFDVVYAYPWPAEQRALVELFRFAARPGSLLVTYHGGRDLRVHRRPFEDRAE